MSRRHFGGKTGSHRNSTTGFSDEWYSGGNKTSSVRSSIILGSEEGLTSLTKSNSANFSGGKKKNDAFRGSYFLTLRAKTSNQIKFRPRRRPRP